MEPIAAPRPAGRGRAGLFPVLLAGLSWSALAALSVVRARGWTSDDFFITYRYAENLARGRGFVFNPGERVFGSTDPGLGLLLGALRWLTRAPVDWLASAVFGLALVAMSLLLLDDGVAKGRRLERVVGGTLVLISSLVWANNGAAAPLVLVLLLLAARIVDRYPVLAGVLAGLAVWVRPDAALGVLLLGLLVLVEHRRLPWRYGLAAAVAIAVGALLAWSYFGSPLPNTLGAKLEMAAAAGRPASHGRFWLSAAEPFRRHFGDGWRLFVALGILGQWPLFRGSGRVGRLFVLHCAALAVAYPLLGVPFYLWYILPPSIALLYGGPALINAAVRWALMALGGGRRVAMAGALAGVVLLLTVGRGLLAASWPRLVAFSPPPRLVVYRQAAEWIRDHSRPNDSIAYVEIGVLGYYSQRPIEDLMGLVSPRVRPFVLQGDLRGGFLTRPSEFVLSHPRGRMETIVQARWFPRSYEEVARFADGGRRGGDLVVYRRLAKNRIPPPRPPR